MRSRPAKISNVKMTYFWIVSVLQIVGEHVAAVPKIRPRFEYQRLRSCEAWKSSRQRRLDEAGQGHGDNLDTLALIFGDT